MRRTKYSRKLYELKDCEVRRLVWYRFRIAWRVGVATADMAEAGEERLRHRRRTPRLGQRHYLCVLGQVTSTRLPSELDRSRRRWLLFNADADVEEAAELCHRLLQDFLYYIVVKIRRSQTLQYIFAPGPLAHLPR